MMTLSEILCVGGLLLLIISKVLTYDGVQIKDAIQRNPIATGHLPKEPRLQQWSVQPVSPPGCPERCSCKKNDTHHIFNVDCSSRGLTSVPDLPETTVVLTLENNSISIIGCSDFEHLHILQDLNLASNNIEYLLPGVFQFPSASLMNLNISDNDIFCVDVFAFYNLFQLKTLDLSHNIITDLDDLTFSELSQLIHLNLSFNNIETIAPDAFKGLRSLKTLSLLNNYLDDYTSFHRDVFQDLLALEILNVKANKGYLDYAISPLRNLSHLYMDFGFDLDFTSGVLGPGFRQLTNLQVLHLSKVYFMFHERYKPESQCFVDNSTLSSNYFDNIRTEKSFELYMSKCDIEVIEDNAFIALPTLISLDLSGNHVIDFTEERQSWIASFINTTITSLDLSFTLVFNGPYYIFLKDCWFQDLAKTNMKMLSLRKNKLFGINAYSTFPSTIEKLDVSENSMHLTFLYYNSFLKLDAPDFKLRELHTNDQRFQDWTKQISQEMTDGGNDRMNGSNVLNNYLNRTTISRTIGMDETGFGNVWNHQSKCPEPEQDSNFTYICLPSHLEVINARSAFIPWEKSVPHILVLNNTVLSHAEWSENLLTSWIGPIENVPSLTFLNLSKNYCEHVDVNFFKYMVNLEVLILKENYISSSLAADVDGLMFSTLTNLRVLDVSQNIIQDLNRLTFVNNINLETLDLSYNRLTEFQPTLSMFRNMSFLNLSRNLLPGLSEQTCQELKLLKSRNKMFTVNLLHNRLLFTCDYLPFLDLLISDPHIFFNVEHLKFRCINRTIIFYKDLADQFPSLARECLIQRYFIAILIMFFVVVSTVAFCAVIYHKRWKLRYLYYIGHRRMHIGEHVVDYVPAADVYITYDQDDLRWRRFMQRTFLPGLNQRNITYILGETDFPGGDIMAHVTGAVVGTRKTVVLLSVDIFDDHHREFEMNLAIMREMDTRSLKIVPIFVEEVDLALYPQEVELFLQNQWQRCLSYSDNDEFWNAFVDAVREEN